MTHRLGCERPDVHVSTGVTKRLITCRNCHAQEWEPLR